MNALNDIWLDIYILQIKIQNESERLTNKMEKNWIFKDIKFPVKVRDIHKIKFKEKIPLAVFLVTKIRKNIESMCQKNVLKVNILIYY